MSPAWTAHRDRGGHRTANTTRSSLCPYVLILERPSVQRGISAGKKPLCGREAALIGSAMWASTMASIDRREVASLCLSLGAELQSPQSNLDNSAVYKPLLAIAEFQQVSAFCYCTLPSAMRAAHEMTNSGPNLFTSSQWHVNVGRDHQGEAAAQRGARACRSPLWRSFYNNFRTASPCLGNRECTRRSALSPTAPGTPPPLAEVTAGVACTKDADWRAP